MLALMILLWAEAGLAMLPGDQVMQCSMSMHGHGHAMAEANVAANADDADAMPCCPDDSKQTTEMAASHPQCCSNSEAPERPLSFLINSERATPHHADSDAVVVASFVPPLAAHTWVLRTSIAPTFAKPVLDLKSDLRI